MLNFLDLRKRYRYKVVDEHGKTLEKFRSPKVAQQWADKKSKELYGKKFKVVRLDDDEK